jgi:DNA-binding MarR family transcriptional regulator
MQDNNPYGNCLFYSANALSRIVTKMGEEEFAVTGLTPSYAFILLIVCNQPGIATNNICKLMNLTPSTVTRLLDKLEALEYVERKTETKFTYIFPTTKGKDLEPVINQVWQNLNNKYVELLGKSNYKKLTEQIFKACIKMDEK